MKPITINPFVYVLELEDDKYYIGITYNLNLRYSQHLLGLGAGWTKLYKPVRIKKVIANGSKEIEKEKTIHYIKKYGFENVRGGPWTRMNYVKIPDGF